MNPCKVACCAVAVSVLSGNAWGAETAGRITYLSADHRQLMLDNSRMYTLANSAEAGKVDVGERVELKLSGADDKLVSDITRLS